MIRSKQDTWNKFERWAYRYKTVCHRVIEEMFDCEYPNYDEGLFLRKSQELNQDIVLESDVSESKELSTRIYRKINFLRGYLVDISYDGPDFMAKYSYFVTLEFTSRCINSLGIWLEHYI